MFNYYFATAAGKIGGQWREMEMENPETMTTSEPSEDERMDAERANRLPPVER